MTMCHNINIFFLYSYFTLLCLNIYKPFFFSSYTSITLPKFDCGKTRRFAESYKTQKENTTECCFRCIQKDDNLAFFFSSIIANAAEEDCYKLLKYLFESHHDLVKLAPVLFCFWKKILLNKYVNIKGM